VRQSALAHWRRQEDAQRVAGTLLPDILPFDHLQPASYPSNGRKLTDDVLDRFLAILTNGKVTTDGLGAPTTICSSISLTSGRRASPLRRGAYYRLARFSEGPREQRCTRPGV